jgi:hypothetical protein
MHLRLDPGVHRLRSRSSTADAASHLLRAGWSVCVVDVAAARSKQDLLEAFAADLGFPAWVGRNWDAMSDALRDLSWWVPGDRGRALIVAGAGHLGDELDRDWAILCEILGEATDRWRTTDTPLGVLVRGRALG